MARTSDATGEAFKGLVHAVSASLAATMALYNALEFSRRRHRRNRLNACLYGALWAFEVYQTRQHWRP